MACHSSRICFLVLLLACRAILAQTSTNSSRPGAPEALERAEQIRTACIEGRRYVCGKVLQIRPDGLVVDSGYADLLKPPFNRTWVVSGRASVSRDPHAVEQKKTDAICVGLVFLTGVPKKPIVNEYDYVVLHAYPAGDYEYKPVPGVEKTIRGFSASLERAIQINMNVNARPSENPHAKGGAEKTSSR
jgi:hypothetical protein